MMQQWLSVRSEQGCIRGSRTDPSMVKYKVAIVNSIVAKFWSNVPDRYARQWEMGTEVPNLHDKGM